ncbi:hypothetical protein TRVA0_009S01508 [Trichomonascus vanleenenianus]|uniref:uncharacterized protein n=1 Tax=Trichomonascus vanleenenianus TaxID=2268995 RepID=UPI003EC9FCAA
MVSMYNGPITERTFYNRVEDDKVVPKDLDDLVLVDKLYHKPAKSYISKSEWMLEIIKSLPKVFSSSELFDEVVVDGKLRNKILHYDPKRFLTFMSETKSAKANPTGLLPLDLKGQDLLTEIVTSLPVMKNPACMTVIEHLAGQAQEGPILAEAVLGALYCQCYYYKTCFKLVWEELKRMRAGFVSTIEVGQLLLQKEGARDQYQIDVDVEYTHKSYFHMTNIRDKTFPKDIEEGIKIVRMMTDAVYLVKGGKFSVSERQMRMLNLHRLSYAIEIAAKFGAKQASLAKAWGIQGTAGKRTYMSNDNLENVRTITNLTTIRKLLAQIRDEEIEELVRQFDHLNPKYAGSLDEVSDEGFDKVVRKRYVPYQLFHSILMKLFHNDLLSERDQQVYDAHEKQFKSVLSLYRKRERKKTYLFKNDH